MYYSSKSGTILTDLSDHFTNFIAIPMHQAININEYRCYGLQEKTNLIQTPIANTLQQHRQAGAVRFKEKVS